MFKEKIIDLATGEETYRDYTAEEIAAVEAAQTESLALAKAEAEKQAARQGLLDRLGITADEAKLLLG